MKQVIADDLVRDLVRDFGVVAGDLEMLTRATTHNASDKVTAIRGRIEQLVKTVKTRLRDIDHHVTEQTRVAAKEADTYVRENALVAIAAAANVGVIAGLPLHPDRKEKR